MLPDLLGQFNALDMFNADETAQYTWAQSLTLCDEREGARKTSQGSGQTQSRMKRSQFREEWKITFRGL